MGNFTRTAYCPVNELDHARDLQHVHGNETRMFRNLVEKELQCKTCYRDDESAWVYREGDSFTLGYLGFMNKTHTGRRDTNTKYTCVSKNIVNWKYNEGQDQHHMAGTTSLDKAVKNARRYFRSWSPIEIANISYRSFTQEFANVRWAARNNFDTTMKEFTNSVKEKNDAFKELGYLLDSTYEFKFPTVRKMIEDIYSALDGVKETGKRNPKHMFVYIRERMGVQEVGMFEVDADSWHTSIPTFASDVHWVKAEDMDVSLRQNVVRLLGLEKNGYIDGIGFKAADNCFYVAQ